MKQARSLVVLLMAVGVFLFPTAHESEGKVYIDIDAPGFTQFPIAIPEFINMARRGDDPTLAKESREVLTDDLFMAGIFDVVDPSLYTPSPDKYDRVDKIDSRVWMSLGAEAVIKGGYEKVGDTLVLELRLYDVVNGTFIFGRRYRGDEEDFSRMVHKFADELMLEYTGETGIFQSMIAFTTDQHGEKEIYIMDIDGRNKIRCTNNTAIDLSPDWSPDGTKLVYCSFKQRYPRIFTVDITSFVDTLIASYDGINISPSYSPSGSMIAFTSTMEYDANIYVMSDSGGGVKKITSGDIDVSPAWSPDGSMIAFTSNRGGGPQIYIMNVSTGSVRRLTYSGGYNTSPAWSPKGDTLAYVGTSAGLFQVYVINTDGSGAMRLTNRGDNENPTWSPDGNLIAFSSTRGGTSRIYWMRADGSDQTMIPGTGGNDTAPTWSPRVEFQ